MSKRRSYLVILDDYAVSVDLEDLIDLVRAQPALWNPDAEGYRNVHANIKAWVIIAETLHPEFVAMDYYRKKDFCDALKKKWGTLRTNYYTRRKEYLLFPHLSVIQRKYNKYYLTKKLQFLDPYFDFNTPKKAMTDQKIRNNFLEVQLEECGMLSSDEDDPGSQTIDLEKQENTVESETDICLQDDANCQEDADSQEDANSQKDVLNNLEDESHSSASEVQLSEDHRMLEELVDAIANQADTSAGSNQGTEFLEDEEHEGQKGKDDVAQKKLYADNELTEESSEEQSLEKEMNLRYEDQNSKYRKRKDKNSVRQDGNKRAALQNSEIMKDMAMHESNPKKKRLDFMTDAEAMDSFTRCPCGAKIEKNKVFMLDLARQVKLLRGRQIQQFKREAIVLIKAIRYGKEDKNLMKQQDSSSIT